MTALSVIVPLAPGETEAAGLLAQLATALPADSEVLLVGAADPAPTPPDWPARIAVRRLPGPAGRARQLNAGAEQAAGAWLWFLHADSRLTAAASPALARFIASGEDALGWFDLGFRPDGPPLMRLNAWGANRRSAWLGMPFGDQGLVVPARCFAALGGFDETARYGEDHLLVWTARRHKLPLRRIGATLLTSARKYQRGGWAAVTARHLWLAAIQAWPEWRRLRRQPPR